MKRLLVVLGTNSSVGQIVEAVFETELKSSDWLVKGVYGESLKTFEPQQGNVLVVDRRLADFMAEKFARWCSIATHLVPFDETGFNNIHECFRYLLDHCEICEQVSRDNAISKQAKANPLLV